MLRSEQLSAKIQRCNVLGFDLKDLLKCRERTVRVALLHENLATIKQGLRALLGIGAQPIGSRQSLRQTSGLYQRCNERRDHGRIGRLFSAKLDEVLERLVGLSGLHFNQREL